MREWERGREGKGVIEKEIGRRRMKKGSSGEEEKNGMDRKRESQTERGE